MHERLPLVVFPDRPGADASDRALALRVTADRYLTRLGAILFRGFDVRTPEGFQRFARSFGVGVDHAGAEASMELGHVRARSGAWPLSVCLCATAAEPGFTLLADGRDVFRALPKRLRARFVERGLMQVQRIELSSGAERARVDEGLCARGASVEWLEPGVALARRRLPAVIAHPLTHELVWLGDVRATEREALVHADGTAIEPSVLEEIEAAFDEARTVLEWEAGDVLLLDNLIMSHVHVAPEGGRFAPDVLLGEPSFSPSADDVRWVEAPRPGPRRVEPSDAPRAPVEPCRFWA